MGTTARHSQKFQLCLCMLSCKSRSLTGRFDVLDWLASWIVPVFRSLLGAPFLWLRPWRLYRPATFASFRCVEYEPAKRLCQAVRHVMGTSLDSIAGHCLAANSGTKKTAALIAHKGSRAANDGGKGKIPVLRENCHTVFVDVVPSYNHLGPIVTHSHIVGRSCRRLKVVSPRRRLP